MAKEPHNPTASSVQTPELGAALSMALFHGTAVALIYGLTLLPFMYGRIGTFIYSLGTPEFLYASLPQIGGHLVLAAILWGGIYWLWSIRSRRSEAGRAIKTARGTAITETLIVIPVFLLLVCGMAQTAINSAAGMLANLAAYEAARAVWVWHPETNRFNGGGAYGAVSEVNDDYVREMARIQAAAVLTPVAHSYGTSAATFDASSPPPGMAAATEEFRQFRGALVGAQIDRGGMEGAEGRANADQLAEMGAVMFGDDRGRDGHTFVMALDSSRYPVRSAWKLSGAYLSTSVDFEDGLTNDDGLPTIRTTLTYNHYIAMPLMGPVFGTGFEAANAPGGREGHYAPYQRQFTYVQQVDSNPGAP